MGRKWTDEERARHSKAMKATWAKKQRPEAAQRAPKNTQRVVVTKKTQTPSVGFLAAVVRQWKKLSGSRA